jgi:hypothetical protein
MKGELLKRGSARSLFGRKSWKLRYFVLDEEGCLQYYKSKEDYERDPESRLKGRRINVGSVHAEQHDVADFGGSLPSEHADRGLVLESEDGSVTLRVCGSDKDHEEVTTTWIRALKSAGADAPGVPPQAPERVKPLTPPGEPESSEPTAAESAAAEAEADLKSAEAADAAAAAAADGEQIPPPIASPATDPEPNASPPPPPPPAAVPAASSSEHAASGPAIELDGVQVDEAAPKGDEPDASADARAAEVAEDAEDAPADESAGPVEAAEANASTDEAAASEEVAASAEAEAEDATTTEAAEEAAYTSMDLEVIEEHLAQELAAMAPPPDDRDDSDLQDATADNLDAIYNWMDVNKDGEIQVVEFAKATSGKHRESMIACGKSLADVSEYKM